MTTRNSPKTPYEIRLDLLNLAQSVLVMQHQAKAEADARTKHAGDRYVETAPTTEEIIAEAEKMNGFISKANQSSH